MTLTAAVPELIQMVCYQVTLLEILMVTGLRILLDMLLEENVFGVIQILRRPATAGKLLNRLFFLYNPDVPLPILPVPWNTL